MNRLQKKCFLAAAGLHLLLLLILFIGPAFLPSKQSDNLPPIDFVPWKTVDALVSGGGNPNAAPPPAAPVQTPPAPQPQAVVQPPPPASEPPKVEPREVVKAEPVKEIEKPELKNNKPDPDAVEPPKPTKRKIEISTTVVKRDSDDIKAAAAKAAAETRARELADAKRRAAAINSALSGLKSGLSSSTTIEMKGPGGGGLPYANWRAAVKSLYEARWRKPVTDPASVTASITIARDGTVLSARVISPSGNGTMDRSVQTVLEEVKSVPPLPEEAKEDQRTINITFELTPNSIG